MKNDIQKLREHITYMRAKEVAFYLSIGLSSVWKMAKEGRITGIKISSRTTLFLKDEIDKLIENKIS